MELTSANNSNVGANILHGPHHDVLQSTTTGFVWDERNASNASSLSMTVTWLEPPATAAARRVRAGPSLPRRQLMPTFGRCASESIGRKCRQRVAAAGS